MAEGDANSDALQQVEKSRIAPAITGDIKRQLRQAGDTVYPDAREAFTRLHQNSLMD